MRRRRNLGGLPTPTLGLALGWGPALHRNLSAPFGNHISVLLASPFSALIPEISGLLPFYLPLINLSTGESTSEFWLSLPSLCMAVPSAWKNLPILILVWPC